MRATQPIRLTGALLKPATETLVRAFENYPLMTYFFPDAQRRPGLLSRLIGSLLRYGLADGEVCASSAQIEGVAVWLPNHGRTSLWPVLRFGAGLLLATAGTGFVRRFWPFYRQIELFQQRHAAKRHCYLQLLGVDPAHRRQGHARQLLMAMFERLDREHMPCFLDTEEEQCVRLYERFGFRTLEASRVLGTEIGCWFMCRPAANS